MNFSRYSDATWASWCVKSWSTRLLFQQVAEAEITNDIDILLSTTQTKYDIGMVRCSDVTTLSQFLESPAPRLLFQQLV